MLINSDMRDLGNTITPGSVDLLLTDPPYNISEGGANIVWRDPVTGENRNTIHSQQFSQSFEEDWDSVSHDQFLVQLSEWAIVWNRLLRPGGGFLIFISDRYLSYLWQALSAAGLDPKRAWTWKKPAAVPFNRRHNPVSACEYAVWGIKPGGARTFCADAPLGSRVERFSAADKISSIVYRLVRESDPHEPLASVFARAQHEAQLMLDRRKQQDGIIECVIPNTVTYSGGIGRDRIHPTQKPRELLSYFIELLSNPGDLVLDTFAGSGSTGHAALDLGRRCVLVERDARMFELMSQSLANRISP